jgi:hypothetical protein
MSDMVLQMSNVDEAYAIIARQRVKSVSSSDMPTVDDYRKALIQCVVDKAHDWRAACESAEAASKEVEHLKAEIARLRITDAEREAVEGAVGFCECTTSPLPTSQQIATLRSLLARTE